MRPAGGHPEGQKVEQPSTPYRDAAPTYRGAGWRGVLPIPYRTKKLQGPKAVGWTGHAGKWPSGADVQAWCDSDATDEGRGNIALRLPADVIGIDIDDYGSKTGGADLMAAVERWGHLPNTWTSTARDDGKSGIRFFRIPEGLRWPGQVGPSIEVIQSTHRYAVVWPSVHPEGRVYRWYRPDGVASLAPPRPDELPDLPDAWIAGLTGGELAEDVVIADMRQGDVAGWIAAHGGGQPCRAMRATADRLLEEMRTGSAHESLRHLMALARHAEKGHTGLGIVVGEMGAAFMAEATSLARKGSTRDPEEARGEWARSLAGAVRRIVGNPTAVDSDEPLDDPCDNPFAGLVAPTPQGSEPVRFDPPPMPASPLQATAVAVEQPVATPVIEAVPLERPCSDADEEIGYDELLALAGAPAPQPAAQPSAPPVAAAEPKPSSWTLRDITEIVTGEYVRPEATVLTRADGLGLFYAGKVNGLLGESESGKSWLLLAAMKQQLEAEQPVLFIDFEDDDVSVVGRLLDLGVDRELLLPSTGLFGYMSPEESLHYAAAGDLRSVLDGRTYSLIGVDGVNAAMTLQDLDLTSNKDATRFAQLLLKPLAQTGAAVVTVDHVPKASEQRGKGGIGAQAKRAMVTGCSILVEVRQPFGRGSTGKLQMTVDKDRVGYVRGIAEYSKNAGLAVLESGSEGSVNVRIDPPGMAAQQGERQPFRPTAMMEKISRLLSTTEGDLSQTQIEQSIEGRASIIRLALDALVAEGYVSRHAGPRNSMLHRYENTYREMSELVGGEAGDGPDEY